MGFIKQMDGIFFPQDYRCKLCGTEIFGGDYCNACIAQISFNDGIVCPVCGRRTAKDEICMECKASAPLYEKAASPLVYEKGGMALVARFKRGAGWLAVYFARLAATKLKTFPSYDIIVYVPCSLKAASKRGYDQAELFAREVGRLTGVPVADAVIKIKETPQQKELSKAERFKNLQGTFKADRQAVKGKSVLVVDDVLTTGATLDSVAYTLKKAGAAHIYALTAASVEYKDGRRAKDKN